MDDRAHSRLPLRLTSFIGREPELAEVRELLARSRLVTLVGSGGAGKTRLAIEAAAAAAPEFPDGVWLADLAPLSAPGLVADAVARAAGLPEDPARSAVDAVARHVGDGRVLVLLDNCEHLVASSAAVAESLLAACPSLVVLATSREPLSIPGEATFRVPSLRLPDDVAAGDAADASGAEAVRLFVDRARLARPGFAPSAAARAIVEICRRLDGIPLAIELAAARVRVLSVGDIAAGLEDRFRLLEGGARTSLPRQQTLRASIDWSYALLSEAERAVFRRLAVFPGTFDLAAAEAVACGTGDGLAQVAPLVEKSLVVSVEADGRSRFRLLETMRHYALERLAEAGEEAATRGRHRDHYLAFAEAAAECGRREDHDRWGERLAAELDNLRAAFAWCTATGEPEKRARLAIAMYDLWWERGYFEEGRAWFEAVLADTAAIPEALRVAALTVGAYVEGGMMGVGGAARAREAVARARELGDKTLLAGALNSAATALVYFDEGAGDAAREAADLCRETGDVHLLGRPLGTYGATLLFRGQAQAGRAVLGEALAAAEAGGNTWAARYASWLVGVGELMHGELHQACRRLADTAADARRIGDRFNAMLASSFGAVAYVMTGHEAEAREAADRALAVAHDMGVPMFDVFGRAAMGMALMGAGDVHGARAELEYVCLLMASIPILSQIFPPFLAEVEVAAGDLEAARRRSDEAVARSSAGAGSFFLGWALDARARADLADGDVDQARELAHRSLAARRAEEDQAGVADALDLLGYTAEARGDHALAARLVGAGDAQRERVGYVRLGVFGPGHARAVAAMRDALGPEGFEAAYAEGAGFTIDAAVAYATRGRGSRRRPATGWSSLTPGERDVVRLVAAGLSNKEIAARLLMSPHTVKTHLTHVYAKLGIESRVQLATEAAGRL